MINQAAHLGILRSRKASVNANPAIRLGLYLSMAGFILDDSASPERAVAELRAFFAATAQHEAELDPSSTWLGALHDAEHSDQ